MCCVILLYCVNNYHYLHCHVGGVGGGVVFVGCMCDAVYVDVVDVDVRDVGVVVYVYVVFAVVVVVGVGDIWCW